MVQLSVVAGVINFCSLHLWVYEVADFDFCRSTINVHISLRN